MSCELAISDRPSDEDEEHECENNRDDHVGRPAGQHPVDVIEPVAQHAGADPEQRDEQATPRATEITALALECGSCQITKGGATAMMATPIAETATHFS